MDAIPHDCITFPEAVGLRAKIISDYELQREFGDYTSRGEPWNGAGGKPYLCRELAVRELYRKLIEGSITAYIQDQASGEMMRLLQEAWKPLAFWRQTLCAGVIHAAACEAMEKFNGRTVFLKRSVAEQYLASVTRRKPASMKADCRAWLEGLVRASPENRVKPKDQLRREAKVKFGVTWREFNECWKVVNQVVPESTWRRPGAPKKS